MKFVDFEFTIPIWCITPLIYSDLTGLSECQTLLIENFETCLNDLVLEYEGSRYTIQYPSNIDESIFIATFNDVDSIKCSECINVKIVVYL